jgi:hypothetical protein
VLILSIHCSVKLTATPAGSGKGQQRKSQSHQVMALSVQPRDALNSLSSLR